jgi:DinB superfamily
MSAQPNPMPAPVIDKQFLLNLLRESRHCFLESFAEMTEEEAHLRPAPDRWSVLETVEHLTTAETIQLKLLQTQRTPRPANAPNRELPFLQMVGERTHKMQSPEGAVPNGRFTSLHTAATQFKTIRAAVIQLLNEIAVEDLRSTEVKHPHPAAGMVSTCEMFIVMAKHAERHAKQIEEIRDQLAEHNG